MGGLAGLCGDAWVGWSLNPCWLESIGMPVVAAAVLIALLLQRDHIANVMRMIRAGEKYSQLKGMSGREVGATLATGFLTLLHTMHLIASASMRLPAWHTALHAVLAALWAATTWSVVWASKAHAVLDGRMVSTVVLAFYLVILETYWTAYTSLRDTFPLSYVRATIWTAMLQTMVTTLLSFMDWSHALKERKKRQQQEAGYQPLPAADVEAAPQMTGKGGRGPHGGMATLAAGIVEGEGHSWVALFWEACVYVWPTDPWLRARTLVSFTLLLIMRVLNLGVPVLYKAMVDDLAGAMGGARNGTATGAGWDDGSDRAGAFGWLARHSHAPAREAAMFAANGTLADAACVGGPVQRLWAHSVGQPFRAVVLGGEWPPPPVWGWLSPFVVAYLAATFLQGGTGGGTIGFINNLRQYLYIPVSQDAYRRISVRTFRHVLGLDLGFHLGRKTGEVTKIIDRGTSAMQNILSTILFQIFPTFIDVLTASTYLAQALEPSIALTVFITVGSYIPVTIIITEWRGQLRRDMNRTEQVMSARVTDALLNYETVKYFTGEGYEQDQYAKSMGEYQSSEFRSLASMNALNVVQSVIMWGGTAVGLVVCARGVHAGELSVGDVVLFLALMGQLMGPLNFFGSYYRILQQYMIDMENLFGLLSKTPAVKDAPGARDVVVSKGRLEFENVTFEYERGAPVLKSVNWVVEGGRTIAFVGATGSGKSTITRLVFRFYDPTSGRVLLDGVDIRSVTSESLRRNIGMVPQDTVLFNDTILSNIRYGNLEATDEQVYAAARAACIHEAITTRFPKGYDTVVGERGLRLSGGEKQRVAFARALLKNAPLLVLDEATSALDTLTERAIQSALTELRTERTTLIVAHRLSTIADANTIVVLHHGEVREVGSHANLLATGGLYATLWNKQAGAGGTAIDTNDDDNATDLDGEVAAPAPGQGASPLPALPPGSSTDSMGAVQGIPTQGVDGGAQATTGKGKKKGGGKKH